MVRSVLSGSKWVVHDAWFRRRMVNDFGVDETTAEKMSRFILSLFMSQVEVDYRREKELFKYAKHSPNCRVRTVSLSDDYCDAKSPWRVAIEELSEATDSTDEPDQVARVAELVAELRAHIDGGRRKRKVSDAQSVTSSRSSSSSSSYEEEFPSLGKERERPIARWLTPDLMPIKKTVRVDKSRYRFAFKKRESPPPPPSTTPPPLKPQKQQKPKKTKASKKAPTKASTPPPPEKGNDEKKRKDSKKEKSRTRKRKRPRKKKTSATPKDTDSGVVSPVPPLPRAQNLDSFGNLDDALNFLKSQSGSDEPRDAKIWRKVMADQHVKYVNGSFFFSPRLKFKNADAVPSKPKQKQKEPSCDPALEQAARVAYGSISHIFDDDNEEPTGNNVTHGRPIALADSKWPVKSDSNPIWTNEPW